MPKSRSQVHTPALEIQNADTSWPMSELRKNVPATAPLGCVPTCAELSIRGIAYVSFAVLCQKCHVIPVGRRTGDFYYVLNAALTAHNHTTRLFRKMLKRSDPFSRNMQ